MDNIEENKNHFMGYDFTMKHGGIDESRYKNVFYGDIEANNLEDIYEKLNVGNKPPTYMGYSLSVSDVIEVIEGADDNLNGKTFFCDDVGYKTIDFDTSKCQPMEGKRCVYITPGNKPLVIKLNINEYDVLNNAGYYQLYMGGEKRTFSGKYHFLKMHGYDEICGQKELTK